MWKLCKNCQLPNQYPMNKLCRECYYVFQKDKPEKRYSLKRTPVKKIGEKRKERIKKWWSETAIHKKVYAITKICQMCWKYVQPKPFENMPEVWCFAHILSKAMYPHLRLFINNILFVCSIECHDNFDTLIAWNNKSEIEAKILAWKNINPKDYEIWDT